jgi:hypothetical protein
MKILEILFVLYVISLISNWYFFHKIYSKEGRWSKSEPEQFDLFVTFCPVFNFICLLIILFIWIQESLEGINLLEKIFLIKK